MVHTHEEKLAAAISYLRSRSKYLLDRGKWVPTSSAQTDVRQTIAEYKSSIEGKARLKGVSSK